MATAFNICVFLLVWGFAKTKGHALVVKIDFNGVDVSRMSRTSRSDDSNRSVRRRWKVNCSAWTGGVKVVVRESRILHNVGMPLKLPHPDLSTLFVGNEDKLIVALFDYADITIRPSPRTCSNTSLRR